MNAFRRIVLGLGLLGAGYVSFNAMTSPGDLLDSFDVLALTADGRSAIRGQYGGFYLAVALVMLSSLVNLLTVRTGLFVLLVAVGGVFTGRILSLVMEGPTIWERYSSDVQAIIVAEGVLALLTLVALIGGRPQKT